MFPARVFVKEVLSRVPDPSPAVGLTALIWHRVGGGSADELDLPAARFREQADELVRADIDVLSLDDALDRLGTGDPRPSIVLTFDDGFADVYANAWPVLRERLLPFTVYVAGGLIGGSMRWEGSAGTSQGAPALSWEQLREMAGSGLCTVGNHTWSHARPEAVGADELDRCSDVVAEQLGQRPRHFAWPWGVEVPAIHGQVADRFRSAATARAGRNPPGSDPLRLARVPVRRTDPPAFFAAKLRGDLRAERAYAGLVGAAKRVRRLVP